MKTHQRTQLAAGLSIAFVVAFAASTMAVTISNINTSATLNFPGTSASDSGVAGLNVLERNTPGGVTATDVIQDVEQHWYFIETAANVGALTGAMAGIDSLGGGSASTTSSSATASYTDGSVAVEASYSIGAGNPGDYKSTVNRRVTVTNNGGASVAINLASYGDYGLNDLQPGGYTTPPADERIVLTNGLIVGGIPVAVNIGVEIVDYDSGHPCALDGSFATAQTCYGKAHDKVYVPGDTNGDLAVDSNRDLATMLANLGTSQIGRAGNEIGDLNGDGIVDSNNDLSIILSQLGVNMANAAAGNLGVEPDFADVSASSLLATVTGAGNVSSNSANTRIVKDVDPAGLQSGENFTWARQWQRTLAPGESLVIDEQLLILPEPGSIALLGIGASLLMIRRRQA